MEKIKETKHFKNSAPFRPFLEESGQNSAADLFGRSYIFIRPLLSFAAKESASCEHSVSSGHGRMNYKDTKSYMSAFL